MPQLLLGGIVSGLLEVFHALGDVRGDTQIVAVQLAQQIKSGRAIPVDLFQIRHGLGVVLLGPLAVGVASTQVIELRCGAVVLRPLQKLEGLGVVPLHPFTVIVEHAQPVGRVGFYLDGGGQRLLIVLGGPSGVLGDSLSHLIGVARPEKGPGLSPLCRPAVEIITKS